ncbi:MAG: GHKL domain-containing protein [Desulfobacterales bacterium]|nr:GHKL domain-containing protein [Desulfobacterales bacterium]
MINLKNTNELKTIPRISQYTLSIAVVFFLITTGLIVILIIYWDNFLEPQLINKAKLTLNAIAQSQIRPICDAIENYEDTPQTIKKIENIVNIIFLLKEADSNIPFVEGIRIEVDYDFVKAKEGTLDLAIGSIYDNNILILEIPMYSKNTHELLGISIFYGNPNFLTAYKSDVKSAYIITALMLIFVLIFAWIMAAIFIIQIRKADKEIKKKQAQVIHAGRLTAMGEMATGIAHEINQPLAIIRLAADGLNSYFKNKYEDSMEAKAAKKIIQHVNRASGIIDNMRSFARADTDINEFTDIAKCIRNGLSFFNEQFRIHDINLFVSLPDELIIKGINSQKFEQIVVNLISNARYAVDKKAQIYGTDVEKKVFINLYCSDAKQAIIFEVKDNGIGMSSDVMARCMDPFFTTKEVGEGTGLGLSIVHSILKEFKMDIEIESKIGDGSLFRIFK